MSTLPHAPRPFTRAMPDLSIPIGPDTYAVRVGFVAGIDHERQIITVTTSDVSAIAEAIAQAWRERLEIYAADLLAKWTAFSANADELAGEFIETPTEDDGPQFVASFDQLVRLGVQFDPTFAATMKAWKPTGVEAPPTDFDPVRQSFIDDSDPAQDLSGGFSDRIEYAKARQRYQDARESFLEDHDEEDDGHDEKWCEDGFGGLTPASEQPFITETPGANMEGARPASEPKGWVAPLVNARAVWLTPASPIRRREKGKRIRNVADVCAMLNVTARAVLFAIENRTAIGERDKYRAEWYYPNVHGSETKERAAVVSAVIGSHDSTVWETNPNIRPIGEAQAFDEAKRELVKRASRSTRKGKPCRSV